MKAYPFVVDPCRCDEPTCPRWRGLIRDERGFWRRPTLVEVVRACAPEVPITADDFVPPCPTCGTSGTCQRCLEDTEVF